jgi:hypothetical protein
MLRRPQDKRKYVPADRVSANEWIVDWNPYTFFGQFERENLSLRWERPECTCYMDLEGKIATQTRSEFGRVFGISIKLDGGRLIFIKFRNP